MYEAYPCTYYAKFRIDYFLEEDMAQLSDIYFSLNERADIVLLSVSKTLGKCILNK